MPDIMMCDDPICALSPKCRRHRDSGTRPSDRQSYWLKSETSPRGDDCHNYWPIKDATDAD